MFCFPNTCISYCCELQIVSWFVFACWFFDWNPVNFFFLLLASKDPILSVPVKGPKVTAALWGPLDQYIITGHENGDLCQWDTKVWYGLHWLTNLLKYYLVYVFWLLKSLWFIVLVNSYLHNSLTPVACERTKVNLNHYIETIFPYETLCCCLQIKLIKNFIAMFWSSILALRWKIKPIWQKI